MDTYFTRSKELQENLESFLLGTVQTLRKEDPFLYEEICDLPSRAKLAVLESRLDMEYIPSRLVDRVSGRCILECFKAASAEYETSDEFLTEYAEEIFEKTLVLFQSEALPICEASYAEQKNSIVEFIKNNVLKKLPTLGVVGTIGAFTLSSLSFVHSMIVLVAILILSGVADLTSRAYGVNLQKEQLDILNSVLGVFEEIGKFIKNVGEQTRYRYILTYKNEEKCYKAAGLDISKIGFRYFAAIRDESSFRELLFGKEEERLDKLRNCYLENFLDRISIFFDIYFDCLRKSGNWSSIREMSDDKFIQLFRIKGALYPTCDEYRDNAGRAIKTYEKMVNYIFEKSPEVKTKWMLLLNRYILDQRESKEDQMKKHRDSYDPSKKPQFRNPKYNKLGKNL